MYGVILDTISTSTGTANGKQLGVILGFFCLFVLKDLHQYVPIWSSSSDESVKLFNTNVIKIPQQDCSFMSNAMVIF